MGKRVALLVFVMLVGFAPAAAAAPKPPPPVPSPINEVNDLLQAIFALGHEAEEAYVYPALATASEAYRDTVGPVMEHPLVAGALEDADDLYNRAYRAAWATVDAAAALLPEPPPPPVRHPYVCYPYGSTPPICWT